MNNEWEKRIKEILLNIEGCVTQPDGLEEPLDTYDRSTGENQFIDYYKDKILKIIAAAFTKGKIEGMRLSKSIAIKYARETFNSFEPLDIAKRIEARIEELRK